MFRVFSLVFGFCGIGLTGIGTGPLLPEKACGVCYVTVSFVWTGHV